MQGVQQQDAPSEDCGVSWLRFEFRLSNVHTMWLGHCVSDRTLLSDCGEVTDSAGCLGHSECPMRVSCSCAGAVGMAIILEV